MSDVRERMQRDLTAAMSTGDRTRVAVLRSALSALANAEAVVVDRQSSTPVAFGTTEVPRQELDETAVRDVLSRELGELTDTADELRRRERVHDADDLEARAAILASYLGD